MDKSRLQAAREINRLIEFDGSPADDIRRAAVLYLTDSAAYISERKRWGSSVEAA